MARFGDRILRGFAPHRVERRENPISGRPHAELDGLVPHRPVLGLRQRHYAIHHRWSASGHLCDDERGHFPRQIGCHHALFDVAGSVAVCGADPHPDRRRHVLRDHPGWSGSVRHRRLALRLRHPDGILPAAGVRHPAQSECVACGVRLCHPSTRPEACATDRHERAGPSRRLLHRSIRSRLRSS